ncbi:hypothetical protein [Rhizobium rhizogenes]|uniref:hypothetical protein n=1 Tax=Rhizobium rhizogenes TaxID=359 RepID=UPI001F27D434|nr:hypothetical protein [Rhizobium rhizogenes]
MDKLAGDPHAGGRLDEVRPFGKALPDGAAANNLVETRELIFRCGFYFAISIREMSYLR